MSDCNALKETNTHSFGKEAVRGGFISATKIAAIHLITFMLTLLCKDKNTKKDAGYYHYFQCSSVTQVVGFCCEKFP